MTRQPPDTPFTVTYDDLPGQYTTPSRVMDFITSNPPFVVTYDDPPTCGVSNRLERRIRLQFAAVLIGGAVVVGGVVVAIVARVMK